MSLRWMVIYPRGERHHLDIAEVIDYEKNEYDLASFREFEYEQEAALYVEELSKKSGIPLRKGGQHKKHTGILD